MANKHKVMQMGVLLGIVLGVTVGGIVGMGSFTFIYADGASYMFDDPMTCANCHIMNDHYDSWIKSSHKNVATCNDCHTPEGFFYKYLIKAVNGYNHSLAFTTGNFHEPIQIREFNRQITENACRKCHSDIVHSVDSFPEKLGALSCIRCHDGVGHMR